MVTKPVTIVTVTMAAVLAVATRTKNSAPIQATPGKASTGKPAESNGDGSKPTESQKKWVPEQGHWEVGLRPSMDAKHRLYTP